MRFSLMRLLVSMDDFGHRQFLTYKGRETFQTRLGGICTLLIKISTLACFLYYMRQLNQMEEPEV